MTDTVAVLAPTAATAPDTRPTRPRAQRLAVAALPPVAAYLVSHLIAAVAASRTSYDYLDAASHARYDSTHYESIATDGYQLFRCGEVASLGWEYGADAWCGNTGWFPAYSWAIRAVRSVIGLGPGMAGLVVTETATLSAYALLWWLLARVLAPANGGDQRWRRAFGGALAVAVVLPAGIYFHAVFPLSLVAAASLGYVGLLSRRRWWWAGLCGAVAAMAYPMALGVTLVGAGALAAWWLQRSVRGWPALRAALALGGVPALGLAAVFGNFALRVGRATAYFDAEAHYGDHTKGLLNTFVFLVSSRLRRPVERPDFLHERYLDTVHIEMWATLGLVALLGAALVVAVVRARAHAIDGGLLLLAVFAYVTPVAAGTHISQYRAHLVMLPALLLLRHLPGWVTWLLAAAGLPLAYVMATLFYTSMLM